MEIVFRSFFLFFTLMFLVKILGNKQMKQLTLYDYVIGITIGSIGADTIIDLDVPIWNGILSIFLFGVFGYLLSFLSYHFQHTETFIEGKPYVLFQNDQFLEENLEKLKLTPSQVLEQCRLKGCFDIRLLDTAILEPSGEFSILLKKDAQTGIKKEEKKQSLCYSVIVNGIIDEKELRKAKKTKKWLSTYLKNQQVQLEDVFLLSIDSKGKVSLYR